MVSLFKNTLRGLWLDRRVAWIALAADTPTELESRAKMVASEMRPQEFDWLDKILRWGFSKPREAKKRYSAFLSWMDARHDAVFQLLYQGGRCSVVCLCRIAFGSYDWTQCRAVSVLCLLAADGIQTEQIANEIMERMDSWQWETVAGSLAGLSLVAGRFPPLAQKLLELSDDWGKDDPVEQLEVLEPLSVHAPAIAHQRLDALLLLMKEQGKGLARSALADGHVVTEGNKVMAVSGREFPRIPDFHAIRAGLALRRIRPGDEEIESTLRDWADNHPEPQIREELSALLDAGGHSEK